MSKGLAAVQEEHAAKVAQLRRALEVFEDIPRLREIHAKDPEVLPEGARPAPRVVVRNLRRMTALAEEVARLTWALVEGLPKTTACVCRKCKVLLLAEPGGGIYTHCGQIWHATGRDRGFDNGFWNRNIPGKKFKGMLDEMPDLHTKKGGPLDESA
ncbi:hypothetical protein D3C86_1616400 [compost metagenome]